MLSRKLTSSTTANIMDTRPLLLMALPPLPLLPIVARILLQLLPLPLVLLIMLMPLLLTPLPLTPPTTSKSGTICSFNFFAFSVCHNKKK